MSKKLAKLPTLEDCVAGLDSEWRTIHSLAKRTKYRTIAIGLWLLKAQAVIKLREGRPWPSKAENNSPIVGELNLGDGFDAWLATTGSHLGFSRASGYNWLTAALNAGLTAASTLEDVAKLEETDALADRKLTAHDLYSPPRLEDPDPKPAPRIRPEAKAQQTWFPFYEQLVGYGNEEKELNLLNALPVYAMDPTKEVSLQDLEIQLENALARVREVKKEKLQAEQRPRRRGAPAVIEAEAATSEPAA